VRKVEHSKRKGARGPAKLEARVAYKRGVVTLKHRLRGRMLGGKEKKGLQKNLKKGVTAIHGKKLNSSFSSNK